MNIFITGHSDCPLWFADEKPGCGIAVCPEWYKHKKGGHRLAKRGFWNMRRPKKCPAKIGVLIQVKSQENK